MGIKRRLKHLRNRIFGIDFTILDELYWAQVYNSTIQNSAWLGDKSVSPGPLGTITSMCYTVF